ncbi:hypothetical protein [Cognatishimia activa]|uniref:Uncharacterized protein n=1 Tax=Cognatishimia activa TaxID=1715691 RepID=A0A0P1IND9_9RHOB|nr:hypothetical protein [Cognatishimia activa]CUI26375.1 hypothetical protein TA5113_00012 [Cognatishimia activa]CUK25177.1 hypothetical protein TA5114_00967 [Cognatishimia activa]
MVDQLAETPRPTPMLEQELSQETLDAIKAIVTDGSPEKPQEEVKSAICDAMNAAPPQNTPLAHCAEALPVNVVDSTDVIKELIEENRQPDVDSSESSALATGEKADVMLEVRDEKSAARFEAATFLDNNAEPTPAVDAFNIDSESQPELLKPDTDIDLIRQTLAEDIGISEEDRVVGTRHHSDQSEVGEVPPPGIALRLKRHLRNKLRMHMLILKMKIRDRLPTKREVLRGLTPRRLAIAVIIIAILLEPWFIPTVLVLAVFFGALTVLLMGPDRVRHYGEMFWKRYRRKQPVKARALQDRVMSLMEKWQSKVDKLPSKWTGGLHMPQIQSDAEKLAAESAYATRMARIARDEVPKSHS